MTQTRDRILIMSVGTGDIDRPEETLSAPLKKSIATGAWTRVVLLPSSVTDAFANAFAEKLKKVFPSIALETHALPEGDENDADQAYAHYDSVIGGLLRDDVQSEQIVQPEQIEVDFTRGTKAMSAALVLAAMRRSIPCLRYVTGERDRRGMVRPGREEVKRISTTNVDGHRRLDLARSLFERGNFAAIGDILPDRDNPMSKPYPDELVEVSGSVLTAARFFAAWDRLDYASAAAIDVDAPPDFKWKPVWPTEAMRDWVSGLRLEPDPNDTSAMAAHLRQLVVDLLANAERRVVQGQNEDALVRSYRLLELIGQARLFDHGLDSGNLDPNHGTVKAVEAEAQKKKRVAFSKKSGGQGELQLQASRFQAGRLLSHLHDPLAKKLLEFGDKAPLRATLRNNSVLVHGFKACAPADTGMLQQLLSDFAKIAKEDGGADFDARLNIARGPAFVSS